MTPDDSLGQMTIPTPCWRLYRTRAAYHAAEQTKLRAELRPYMEFKKEHGRFPGCGTFQFWLLEDSDRAEWHTILQEKYERASFRPWFPVAPDPSKPE